MKKGLSVLSLGTGVDNASNQEKEPNTIPNSVNAPIDEFLALRLFVGLSSSADYPSPFRFVSEISKIRGF